MAHSPIANRPVHRGNKKRMADGVEHWAATKYEPQLEFETSGPHFPMYAPRTDNDSQDYDDLLPRTDSKDERGGAQRSNSFRELQGDYGNIAVLLFLYLLQGIPLGLTASIPLVLQGRHVSYAQQAVFSFAYWPFSLKLLWAPIVDSIYSDRIGRRKSWLVPTQYLIGFFMIMLSRYVTSVLGDDGSGGGPNVVFLTGIFFSFNFLAATQDIAVDGWALTMLSKKNVGYASTCNAVGQTAGYFLGNVVFLALESPDFCNRYLRSAPQPHGVVTLADFCFFWAIVFLVTTTLVLIFKKETDSVTEKPDEIDDLGISGTYKLLLKIMRLKPVMVLLGVLLTAKMGFAAADGITGLKLVELGVPKDKMALLAIPLVPLQIVLPWVIGKWTAGRRPLDIMLKAYPYRVVLGLCFALVVYWTPSWQLPDKSFPVLYYAMIVGVYCFHQVTVYSIFVAIMSFHAQISDPLVGGTYMTLLNTLTNLGGNWPVTLSLSIVDDLTWKECMDQKDLSLSLGPCIKDQACTEAGGVCVTTVDGYYILSGVCAVIGFLWWRVMRNRVNRLQEVEKREWSCSPGFINRRRPETR